MRYFEDPEYPSLAPIIKLFKICCMWALNRTKTRSIINYTLVLLTVSLILNQCIYMTIYFKTKILISFIQYSVYHIGVVKLLSFEFQRSKWEKIIKYISDTEKLLKDTEACRVPYQKYLNYLRIVIICFFTICTLANFNLFGKTWIQVLSETEAGVVNGTHTKVFYFLWPFEENRRLTRYFDMFVQNFYGDTTSVYVLAWDCLIISLLVTIGGQFDVVKARFVHSLDEEDEEQQMKSLVSCYKHYVALIEHQYLCNSLVSPVIFVYLLLASVNLSTIITKISTTQYSRAELLADMQFLFALLTQLLTFFWHSNEVTEKSTTVSYSVFQSAWSDKSPRIRRQIALLSLCTNKRIVFTAGPFNEMSVATFVAILRGSYSFYTFMNQSDLRSHA